MEHMKQAQHTRPLQLTALPVASNSHLMAQHKGGGSSAQGTLGRNGYKSLQHGLGTKLATMEALCQERNPLVESSPLL